MVSPDGRFFAYQSLESGGSEVYVRPFPNAGTGRWQVSVGGGTAPVWARSGRELFYLDRTRAIVAIPVQTSSGSFSTGTPRKLLEGNCAVPGNFGIYDVSLDGQRFLMLKETGSANPDATPVSAVVILNWFEELSTRLPGPR